MKAVRARRRTPARRAQLRRLSRMLLLAAMPLLVVSTEARAGTLRIIVAGPGAVSLSPPGVHLSSEGVPDGKSSCDDRQLASGVSDPCLFSYPSGTTVTLTATPDTTPTLGGVTPSFARWSTLECLLVTECRVTVGDRTDTVAATFNPLSVVLSPSGPGTVTSQPPGITNCGADSPAACRVEVPLGAPVTLTAQSTESVRWLLGCDLSEGAVCHTAATSDPWWVFAHFGSGEPPATSNRPPRVKVRFSVDKRGSGQGSVRGRKIDCGTNCSAEYEEFGVRERLVAMRAEGSTFEGWQGACAKDPVCVVPVGAVGSVRAVFDRIASRPGASLSVTRVRISAVGRGRRRAIVVRIAVNRGAAAGVRLVRGRRVLAERGYSLRRGSNRLRMRVPRRVGRGRARVILRVRAGRSTRTFTRSLRLRR